MTHQHPATPIRVSFIGAGGVNFGGHGNAWDHATRLEQFESSLITFVGITDVFLAQAEKVLSSRKAGTHGDKWQNTKVFTDYREMIRETQPHCVFIGLPPDCHGTDEKSVETDCILQNVHAFIEKPIGCAAPELMKQFHAKMLGAEHAGAVVSVAYMFRYSALINKVKELINTWGPVRLFQARYHCAYSTIAKQFWWDAQHSGGPIVEQATHFLDLARYLCGDVELETIQAQSIRADEQMGILSKMPIDETKIPVERRTPRVTTASWRFKSGAIGSLHHTVLLHGWEYETQLELIGDGYIITVRDPYHKCLLSYRAPGTTEEKTLELRDDPYMAEIEAFVYSIRDGNTQRIQSNYADAFKTYQLTWAIRRKAEETARLVAGTPSTDRKTAEANE